MTGVSEPLIIGLAGPSGSGKSALASKLFEYLPACEIVSEDSYYRDQSHLEMPARQQTNYDHPAALEHELLVQHLHALRLGQRIDLPIYDFSLHTRLEKTKSVFPKPVILVEGIMLLAQPDIRDSLDLKLFLDVPMDVCLSRRIRRDTAERGRSLSSVLEQYEKTVRSGYVEFIEPSKMHADHAIPNVEHEDAMLQHALNVLKPYL